MAVMQKIKEMFLPEDIVEPELIFPAPKTSYRIYPLTERNLKGVLRLNLRCFSRGETYSKHIFKHLLTEPNTLSYRIVTAERRMAGFIFIVVANENIGHITTIGVAPEHRKRGLAKKLLMHAEESLKKRNFDSVVLEVRIGNYVAQNLYHQLGYSIIQKLDSYYSNGEAAYLMAKSLKENAPS